MGTKIFLAIGAAAEAFMVYTLYHFVKEGRAGHKNRPVVMVPKVQKHDQRQVNSKAA